MKRLSLTRSGLEDSLLIFLLAFAPLALGAVHVWSYCAIALMSLIIFDLHFLDNIGALKHVIKLPASIGILVFLIVNILYITPLPDLIIKFLSPSTYDLWANYTLTCPDWQTLSIYPRATIAYITKLISYMLIYFVVVSKVRDCPPQVDQAKTGGLSLKSGTVPRECVGLKKGTVPIKSPRRSSYSSFILLGALTSVLSILIHSLSDFNLHIPANALYFTVMLAIITGVSGTVSHRDCPQHADVANTGTVPVVINHRFLNKLVTCIITISFSIAVFGIVQKLSYNGKIYWIIEKAGSHFGPYINYDHAAGYLEMCTFLSIAVFLAKISSSSFAHIRKLKDKFLWFSTKEANTTLVYMFISVVMTTALFLTTSRGGIMSFCASLAVFYLVCVICAERRKRKRILLTSLTVLVFMTIMILWVGPESTVDRFKGLNIIVRKIIHERSILSEIRPQMWKDTIAMIKDFPVFGVGLGDYIYIFPKYRTFALKWGVLRYAHNDYFHFIAEMGAMGGIFLVSFFLWYVKRFKECLKRLKGTVPVPVHQAKTGGLSLELNVYEF
jgi:O-antigen ligase